MSAAQPLTRDIDLSGPSPAEKPTVEPPKRESIVETSGVSQLPEVKVTEGKSRRDYHRSSHNGPGRRRPDDSSNETRPEPSSEAGGRLSPETIARELAKVSAQLATHRSDSSTKESPEKKTGAGSDTDADNIRDTTRATTEENRPEATESTPSTTTNEPEDASITVGETTDKPEAVHYGRSRSRRGEKARSDQPQTSEPHPDVPEPKDGFSNVDISFGRGKRKKTR